MVLEFYLCIVNTVRKINTVLPFVTSTYIYNRIYIIIIIFACITRSSRSHNFMMLTKAVTVATTDILNDTSGR